MLGYVVPAGSARLSAKEVQDSSADRNAAGNAMNLCRDLNHCAGSFSSSHCTVRYERMRSHDPVSRGSVIMLDIVPARSVKASI